MIERLIRELEKRDWLQKEMYRNDGEGNITACCLSGALQLTFKDNYDELAFHVKLIETWLHRNAPLEKGTTISGYNDNVAQSKSDVIIMLRKVDSCRQQLMDSWLG